MKKPLHSVVSIRLFCDEKCFGPGLANLLELVIESKSLAGASKKMNMAYSKAWKMVKQAEKELGFNLLDMSSGGKNGGGAVPTDECMYLLEEYRTFEQECNQSIEKIFFNHFTKITDKQQ